MRSDEWRLSEPVSRVARRPGLLVLGRFQHPLYGKVLTRNGKVYAHDEANDSKQGDLVSLMETRPLSKLKRWRVVKVLERARVGQNMEIAS